MNLIEKYNLKVGDEVSLYPADAGEDYEDTELIGVIGEIGAEHFYVWNNVFDGSRGDLMPTKEFNSSWSVPLDDDIEITVINKGPRHQPIDVRKLNKILCSKKATKSKLKETVQVV
jgi:hypothetical protein